MLVNSTLAFKITYFSVKIVRVFGGWACEWGSCAENKKLKLEIDSDRRVLNRLNLKMWQNSFAIFYFFELIWHFALLQPRLHVHNLYQPHFYVSCTHVGTKMFVCARQISLTGTFNQTFQMCCPGTARMCDFFYVFQ